MRALPSLYHGRAVFSKAPAVLPPQTPQNGYFVAHITLLVNEDCRRIISFETAVQEKDAGRKIAAD